MAVIVPYGDANAHGSICDSLSFRRARGKVVLQKKPRVVQPNTAGQQEQKQWFKDTWKDWFKLDAGQIEYLNQEATKETTYPANYYFGNLKEKQEGSLVPLNYIREVTELELLDPIAPNPGDIEWFLSGSETPPLAGLYHLARIFDNANVKLAGTVMNPYTVWLFIVINQTVGDTFDFPNGYSMRIRYIRFDDQVEEVIVEFPALHLGIGERIDMWVDDAWAIYDAWPLVAPPLKTNPDAWPPTVISPPVPIIPFNSAKEITALAIDSTIAAAPGDIQWFLSGSETPPLGDLYHLGRIYDNANVRLAGTVMAPYVVFLFIVINETVGTPYVIPNDYSLTFTYIDFSLAPHTVTIKFPEINLAAGQRVDMWVDENWSIYDSYPMVAPPIKTNPTP